MNSHKHNFFFLLPCVLCIIVVAGIPLFNTIYMSMTDATFGHEYHFIWLQNYYNLLRDPDWRTACKNTLLITSCAIPAELFLGMCIALALHQQKKWNILLRISILIPWAIPTIISARIWSWMLHDTYGVINHILMKLRITSSPILWLASEKLSLISIAIVEVWRSTPYISLLFLASLYAIPKEYAEAAAVDGFSKMQIFRHITFPLLKKTIMFTAILRILDALRIFDTVYIISNGHTSTSTLSVYTRKHIVDYANIGYGSTSASTLILMFVILYLAYIYVQKRAVYE